MRLCAPKDLGAVAHPLQPVEVRYTPLRSDRQTGPNKFGEQGGHVCHQGRRVHLGVGPAQLRAEAGEVKALRGEKIPDPGTDLVQSVIHLAFSGQQDGSLLYFTKDD